MTEQKSDIEKFGEALEELKNAIIEGEFVKKFIQWCYKVLDFIDDKLKKFDEC